MKDACFVKAVAFYGANASGKSSVLDALKFLAGWVAGSANTVDPEEPIAGIEPFALAPGSAAEPTAFGIVFVTGGLRYEYRVAATQEQIFHESLRAFPSAKGQLWFSRDWDDESKSYAWTPDRPTGYQPDPKKREFTLPNVLFLSKAISLGDTQLEPIFRWFKEGLRFFDLSVRMRGLDNEFTIEEFAKGSELAEKVVDVLRHADIGVVGAELPEREEAIQEMLDRIWESLPKKRQTPDGLMREIKKLNVARQLEEIRLAKKGSSSGSDERIKLIHRGKDGSPITLPWASESAGTRRLFTLAGPLLDILQKGQVVCIDELDTSMHPKMVYELLRLVFSAETNSGGAQVLFTTHNPLLLDPTLLRRDQVWFTEKDEDGGSHLYPLTDYQPRKDESWARGYMAGRYGGIPYIPQGLLGSPETLTKQREGS
ncbi:MAG: ATP-binding protein [Verrucomicrobiota bacterium]